MVLSWVLSRIAFFFIVFSSTVFAGPSTTTPGKTLTEFAGEQSYEFVSNNKDFWNVDFKTRRHLQNLYMEAVAPVLIGQENSPAYNIIRHYSDYNRLESEHKWFQPVDSELVRRELLRLAHTMGKLEEEYRFGMDASKDPYRSNPRTQEEILAEYGTAFYKGMAIQHFYKSLYVFDKGARFKKNAVLLIAGVATVGPFLLFGGPAMFLGGLGAALFAPLLKWKGIERRHRKSDLTSALARELFAQEAGLKPRQLGKAFQLYLQAGPARCMELLMGPAPQLALPAGSGNGGGDQGER